MATPLMNLQLRLGIPAGSLQEATAELFRNAGFKVTFASRSYYPSIDDPEIHCTLIRAQEMPRYVQAGASDAGASGRNRGPAKNVKEKGTTELARYTASRRPARPAS